jgi:methane monooxygenase PmoA-like
MTTSRIARGVAALVGLLAPRAWSEAPPPVDVRPVAAERRVDVTVGGKPFTAYVWPERLAKPVLYPIRTARGTLVTRGFPLDPRPGERVDHPHHVGLWFNYGDVNGVDFWNNAETLPKEQQAKMGRIVHKAISSTKSGAGVGELVVDADWIMPDGSVALHERTRFVFRAEGDTRSIERDTELTAGDKPVAFPDNKEGVLGLRVARGLEQPADKPEIFTDASGKPTAVPVLDNTGVTGSYTSSEGLTGDKVWGTRGRWCALAGTVEGEDVVLLVLDHPKNPGYPTYWHARGYGLFAANPLGQAALSNGKETLNFTLQPKARTTFRHRLLVLPGPLSKEGAEREAKAFAR